MSASHVAAALACPSCHGTMHRQAFARRPEGRVDLDICFACQALWFDQYESTQLSAGATLELFRLINERGAPLAQPLAESARCPACRLALRFTHDIQGTNRFTYYRCPQGHGRLTTFFHFLREKQFVRSLSNAEIERLRATVRQVRCSSCGAAVNVERDAACAYCRAPLAILDADAMRRTLSELDAASRAPPVRANPDAAVLDALLEGRRVEQRLARSEREALGGLDLVREAIGLFARNLQ